jgi:regulatory subunit for Cdc7p protein kinase
MKTWSVEKIQRILNALHDHDGERLDAKPVTTRTRPARGAELHQLLQNERRQATTDRDWMSETIVFKGYYLYVHDMDERTKPVMIRDYQKPASNSQGKWPQLRSNSLGKSPYIEEALPRRHTAPANKTAEQVKSKARANTTATSVTITKKSVLGENPNPPVVTHTAEIIAQRHPAPPKRGGSTDQLPMFGSAQASIRKIPRFVQGEPVASGVQHSNITSAVRSAMISSTAIAPGGKSGSTRELNALKRKVLENQAAARQCSVAAQNAGKPTKRKMLNDIAEEARQEPEPRKKRILEKESKPGYCENCHDKFEDFDEVCHSLFRRHNLTITAHSFQRSSQVCNRCKEL